jgi:hypothetical protein
MTIQDNQAGDSNQAKGPARTAAKIVAEMPDDPAQRERMEQRKKTDGFPDSCQS